VTYSLRLVDGAGQGLLGHRRLRICHHHSNRRFYAFVLLACTLVCYRALRITIW
jgi:hypothetical protein